MTLSEFSWSGRRRRSHRTTLLNPNSLSMVERDKGYTRVFVDHDKAKSCAMERAEKVKAHLDSMFPSFVKSMKPSYISGCFVLYLPIHFYRSNLPKENVIICLVDENQEEYPVNYTVGGWFGAGWRSFCVAHQLVEGDALVFQLVKPTQFQVYIIRAFSVAEIGGTSGLLNLDAQDKQAESCKRIKRVSEKTATLFPDAQLQCVLQQPKEETTSNNDEAGLETSDFEEIKDLESFIVVVNASVVDSLLSKEEHSKYYELCCTQKHRLHNGIPERIDSKLAAGIISQTVEVADSIRAAKFSTPKEELAVWKKKLDVLELLGMDVGFLQARVEELSSLLLESREVMYSKRIRKVLAHRDEILEKKKALKHKLTELEGTCRRYETEMEALQVKGGDYEVMFQAVVDAPW